jgi:hypothetical protein
VKARRIIAILNYWWRPFIVSHLAERLLDHEDEVFLLDDLSRGVFLAPVFSAVASYAVFLIFDRKSLA